MQNEDNYKDSQLLLVNPFTGHELHFPSPSNRYCQFILATCMKPYPQFVVIAFSATISPYLQFRRYGDDRWTIVDTNPRQFHWIEDVAVYEGTASHHLIAASDRQQLLLVDDCLQNIYKLDPLRGQWKTVNSLGDQALFLCDGVKNSATLSLPTKMIGRYMDIMPGLPV